MENDIKIIIKCQCGDETDHVVHISQYKDMLDDQDGTCCINLALNHYLPWYKRLILGIKYILGIDNTYHHYTETMVDVEVLKNAVNKLHDDRKQNG